MSSAPAFTHVASLGEVTPPSAGLQTIETWYCVVHVAVTVLALFIVIALDVAAEPEASPLQPANIYCVPVVPATVRELIVA